MIIMSKTPLRISFFGGGTDLKSYWQKDEGCVFSTTINMYLYVILKERQDKKIGINSSKYELVKHVDDIRHPIVREALKMVGVENNVDITILTDVPEDGTGLGTSSSLTVGLLKALYAYKGMDIKAHELARQSCVLEIDILNKTIGKQDQYMATFGGMNKLRFLSNDDVIVEKVNINGKIKEKFQDHLMLFHTGINRKSENILSEQNKNAEKTSGSLMEMKLQVDLGIEFLQKNQFDEFGSLLQQGWQLKKSLSSKISNEYIDNHINFAIEAGAKGVKVSGAGGGGFLLIICPTKNQDSVRKALNSLKEYQFSFSNNGSEIILNQLQTRRQELNVFS